MSSFSAWILLVSSGLVFQMSHGIEVNVTKDDKLCLYAKLMLNFSVSYSVAGNKSKMAVFELPANASSDASKCDANTSTLELKFGEGHSWNVTFSLKEKIYQADLITFTYNLSDSSFFPGSSSNETVIVTKKPEITNIGLDTCYSCKSQDIMQVDKVKITLWDMLVQAFFINGSKSENITSCAADNPTTAVAPTTHVTSTTPAAPITNTTTSTTPAAPITNTTTSTTPAAPITNATTSTTPAAPITNATTSTTPAAPITNATTSTTPAAPITNTTSTSLPPTSTPTPSLPPPSTGNYSLGSSENTTACLLANFGLRIGFTHNKTYQEMNFNPYGVNATGFCGVNSSELLLVSEEITIRLTFVNDTKKFSLQALNVTVNTSSALFIDANTTLSLWEAAVGSSYMCNKEQNYTITSSLSIYTFNLHVQPFAVKKGLFSTAEECLGDAESFLVPIAVGVALLVLILIVLLAYFIGRKRNMATGYESF